jgi:hypothetical protein
VVLNLRSVQTKVFGSLSHTLCLEIQSQKEEASVGLQAGGARYVLVWLASSVELLIGRAQAESFVNVYVLLLFVRTKLSSSDAQSRKRRTLPHLELCFPQKIEGKDAFNPEWLKSVCVFAPSSQNVLWDGFLTPEGSEGVPTDLRI